MSVSEKYILDACCGGRMFWFNKEHPNTVYVDIRRAERGHIQNGWNPNHCVQPDIVSDFKEMPFPDKSFRLVVFDPPHLIRETPSEQSVIYKKYGCLSHATWRTDLREGFIECWRVLADYGILIFKWGECSIKVSEVLSLFPERPLFGHPSGSKNQNHWMVFMKIPGGECE